MDLTIELADLAEALEALEAGVAAGHAGADRSQAIAASVALRSIREGETQLRAALGE